ncbi:MAG: ATP-binding protein [Vulcanimicrobiota bacterium]
MPQELMITTGGSFDNVRLLGSIVNTLCRELEIGEKCAGATELAVVEACNNVIEHAHKGKPDEDLMLRIIITDSSVEFLVYDRGPGFTIDSSTSEAFDDLDPLSESSRGIPIIRSVMDEVYYENLGDRNVLRLVRYRNPC